MARDVAPRGNYVHDTPPGRQRSHRLRLCTHSQANDKPSRNKPRDNTCATLLPAHCAAVSLSLQPHYFECSSHGHGPARAPIAPIAPFYLLARPAPSLPRSDRALLRLQLSSCQSPSAQTSRRAAFIQLHSAPPLGHPRASPPPRLLGRLMPPSPPHNAFASSVLCHLTPSRAPWHSRLTLRAAPSRGTAAPWSC